jgi:hypothetical protein
MITIRDYEERDKRDAVLKLLQEEEENTKIEKNLQIKPPRTTRSRQRK